MERDTCCVAKDVTERIQGEQVQLETLCTPSSHLKKKTNFFFSTEQLKQFVSTAESKQNDIPGHAYFKKINAFIEQNVHVGELY